MKSEIKKNGKIIDELVTFLLKKKHHQLKLDINYTQEKTEIYIFLEHISQEERDLLEECFSQIRDYSIENYGWELMGESGDSAELNLVGMCIDKYRIEEDENNTTMIYLEREH